MALALPGQSIPPVPQVAGVSRLEHRLLSMLIEAMVPQAQIEALANADVTTSALLGAIASDRAQFETFCKDLLNLDPTARAADFLPRAKLIMVWDRCRQVEAVESKAAAERAQLQLPPQVALGELEAAKQALEALVGHEIPKHHCPSEPYQNQQKCRSDPRSLQLP